MINAIYSPARYPDEGDYNWTRIVLDSPLGVQTLITAVNEPVWFERGEVVPTTRGKRNSRPLTELEMVEAKKAIDYIIRDKGSPNIDPSIGHHGYGPLGAIMDHKALPPHLQLAVKEYHQHMYDSKAMYQQVINKPDAFKVWYRPTSKWFYMSFECNLKPVSIFITPYNKFIVRPDAWDPSIAHDPEEYLRVDMGDEYNGDLYEFNKRLSGWFWTNQLIDFMGEGATHSTATIPKSVRERLGEIQDGY